MPGEPGDTDDRVEGCPTLDIINTGLRPCHPALRSRFPPCSARRGHTWPENRSYSTFGRNTMLHHQPPTSISSPWYRGITSESQSNAWICQETELQMRTSELIEENAQQALNLLVQYAQSSRTFFPLLCFCADSSSRRLSKSSATELHYILDARSRDGR